MVEDSSNNRRRRFLAVVTSVFGLAGVGALAASFVASMRPSARARAAGAPVEVDIGDLREGQMMVIEGDIDHYNSMVDHILNNDLDQPAVYDQLKELMNIDSFIDHLVTILYSANTSWGHNTEWWRPRTDTGKWQGLIVDIDRGK